MSLTLELPGDLERQLASQAAEAGVPLEDYVVQVLSKNSGNDTPGQIARTGAELVDFWRREGLIGYRTDITDSVEYARELRRRAERRTHE